MVPPCHQLTITGRDLHTRVEAGYIRTETTVCVAACMWPSSIPRVLVVVRANQKALRSNVVLNSSQNATTTTLLIDPVLHSEVHDLPMDVPIVEACAHSMSAERVVNPPSYVSTIRLSKSSTRAYYSSCIAAPAWVAASHRGSRGIDRTYACLLFCFLMDRLLL